MTFCRGSLKGVEGDYMYMFVNKAYQEVMAKGFELRLIIIALRTL